MTMPEQLHAENEQALRQRVAQLESELAATRERLRKLQEIDQIYTNFVLTVSHELRTPLTLISGYAQQLLLRWASSDEGRRLAMAEKINISSRRLSRLIEDMLLIANVEVGELPIHVKDDVAVRVVVAEALTEMRDRYPESLPTITIRGDDAYVRADGFRLEQVLICLLDNAVKHAPPRSTVTISWQLMGNEMVIAVCDEGRGIDAANRTRLFTRFGRVQNAIGQSHGGIGLGLYIARRLTEAMNGRIWVESARGAGSTFSIAIPSGIKNNG